MGQFGRADKNQKKKRVRRAAKTQLSRTRKELFGKKGEKEKGRQKGRESWKRGAAWGSESCTNSKKPGGG